MSSGRILAIVPARTASTRLPSKALAALGDRPLLARVLERLERMRTLDGILVATSVSSADDAIADLCELEGWPCHRGPEQDVLERVLRAAQAAGATDVLTVGVASPFFPWQHADRVVAQHVASGADLTHDLPERGSGLPEGCGVEVLTLDALGMAWTYAEDDREDLTAWLHARPERFRIELLHASPELERPNYRLAIETQADLRLARRVQDSIAASDDVVDLREAIAVLDAEPELALSNLAPRRKAG